MSDGEKYLGKVSAVLLTIGESTTSQALTALKKQTYPISEIIIIRNKSPFNVAFNEGVAQVQNPFFIQCDADMVLDPDCVAVLMRRMNGNAGLVYGYLRDPLVGNICCIKLYRTSICKKNLYTNHYDCELMYVNKLSKQGWEVINFDPSAASTLGTHREDISSPVYIFERFRLLGIKIYHRKCWWDLAHRLLMLALSEKDEAATASDGILCGFFIESDTIDLLTIEKKSSYLNAWENSNSNFAVIKALSLLLKKTISINPFYTGYLIGIGLKQLKNHHLYKLVPLNFNSLKSIENWSFLFGYTAARYRHLNPNAGYITSSYQRFLPFLNYLQNTLFYHIQNAKTKRQN